MNCQHIFKIWVIVSQVGINYKFNMETITFRITSPGKLEEEFVSLFRGIWGTLADQAWHGIPVSVLLTNPAYSWPPFVRRQSETEN